MSQAVSTLTLPDMVICHCLQVKESQVADSVAVYGATCLKDVIRTCGAGGGCNSCHARIRGLIEAHGMVAADGQPTTSLR